jgi:sodium/potassium-transporting ATPase subunit alpha
VDGHTEAEAAKKNHQLGDNKLSEKVKTPWWIKLLKEMF